MISGVLDLRHCRPKLAFIVERALVLQSTMYNYYFSWPILIFQYFKNVDFNPFYARAI